MENKGKLPNWAFVIDLNSCIGCNACMAACTQENQTPYWAEKFRTKVEQAELVQGDNVGRFFFPRLCMHCQNTPCYYACPTGATYKTPEGVVMVNQDICIGCEACVTACPYDARYRYDYEDVVKNKELFGEEFSVHQVPHVDKCTFCYHRITKGLEPACVSTCPTDCRMWTDLNNPEDPVAQLVLSGRAKPLAEHLGTNPKVYYIAPSSTKVEPVNMEEVYSAERGGKEE